MRDQKFIYNFTKDNYGIDLQNDTLHIKTVLLLDGFNEITREKDNRLIVNEIKVFMSRSNTQVVLTSRNDFRMPFGFVGLRAYHLQPLEEAVVKDYLSRFVDGYDERMLGVLRNPMMLTLYANNSEVKEAIEKKFPTLFDFVENHTIAEILQNYMTCQIGRRAVNDDQNKILQTAFALQYIAPYLAYEIEKEGLFSIPKRRLDELVKEFLDAHGKESFKDAKEDFKYSALT